MPAVEIRNLHREFKRNNEVFHAVKGISLTVEPEQVFCFLGPNGAGKTTTIKILTTLLSPTSGDVRVLGHDVTRDVNKIRREINFVYGGEKGMYGRLTPVENLTYFADLYHIDVRKQKARIAELLELVGLSDAANVPTEKFSKGMKQRLHIARGLINDPKILFLDEPTIGLDPVGARDLRRIVRSLVDMKKTVFLTTHYMAEAEELSQNIAIINRGELVAHGTMDELRTQVRSSGLVEIELPGELPDQALAALRAQPFVAQLEPVAMPQGGQKLKVELLNENETFVQFMNQLGGMPVSSVTMRKPALEDVYFQIIEGKAV